MVSSAGGAFRPRGARAIHHPTKEGGRMVRYTRIRNDTKQKKALRSGRKMQKKCKFRPLILTAESLKIRTRIGDFVAETGAKESIFPTLITTYGLRAGEYSSMVQAVVTMDDLFAE